MKKIYPILLKVVETNFDNTVNRICNRLQKISPSHYEIIDFERHQEREEQFLSLICDALRNEDVGILEKHMISLADTRHNEGYTLKEVQSAIDAIEEELWHTIVHSGYENHDIIDMLFECHRMMVRARNQFATSFAEKQIDTQKRMNKLKERFYIYKHDRIDLEDKSSMDTLGEE